MPPENFEKYQQFLTERGNEPSVSHVTGGDLIASQEHTFANCVRFRLVLVAIFFVIAVEAALVFAIPYASGVIPMIMVVFGVLMLFMMGKLGKSSR